MRTLGYAVLSLLSREDLSGYDLKRMMERPLGYFWSAKHSQIYPELARLEEDGYVTHRVVEQRGKPDKKVFGITAEGREALKAWVTEPPAGRAARDELVLKAYSVWLAEPGAAAALFEEQGRRHEEQLKQYEEIEAWMEKNWGESPGRMGFEDFASYAALRRGIGFERDYAGWCRWVAAGLQERQSG
ncbi:MAG: PadR family transcriptional regulator [Rubrobacteraceae bacterium]